MNVFLTGATGYIGTAVAERLRSAGHDVTGLARSDTAAGRLRAAGITSVRGDFSDPASVGSAARAADGVISMATTYDPSIDGPAIDVMLEGLAGSNKPFIYTSGIWSHGDTGGKVVDETTPPKPAELVRWRQAVEQRVIDGARRGIRTVVIRAGDRIWPRRRNPGRLRPISTEGWRRPPRRHRPEPLAAGTRRRPGGPLSGGAGACSCGFAVSWCQRAVAPGGRDRGRGESRGWRRWPHGGVAAAGGPSEARRLRRRPSARPAGVRQARAGVAGVAALPARCARGS
jgi:hypothetical protein